MSIERIQELENGKVEWRMATSSKAGGLIPQFMTELSMGSSISKVRPVSRCTFGQPLSKLASHRMYLASSTG